MCWRLTSTTSCVYVSLRKIHGGLVVAERALTGREPPGQFEDDGEELAAHIIRNTRRYVHLFSLAADNLMPPAAHAVGPPASAAPAPCCADLTEACTCCVGLGTCPPGAAGQRCHGRPHRSAARRPRGPERRRRCAQRIPACPFAALVRATRRHPAPCDVCSTRCVSRWMGPDDSEVVFKPQAKEKSLAVREVKASHIGSLIQLKVRISRALDAARGPAAADGRQGPPHALTGNRDAHHRGQAHARGRHLLVRAVRL